MAAAVTAVHTEDATDKRVMDCEVNRKQLRQ